jgi:hypothetical protein
VPDANVTINDEMEAIGFSIILSFDELKGMTEEEAADHMTEPAHDLAWDTIRNLRQFNLFVEEEI